MENEVGSRSPRRARRGTAVVAGLVALTMPLSAAAAPAGAAEATEPVNVALDSFAGAPAVEVSYVPGWNSAAALNDGSTTFGGHGDVWGTYGNAAAQHWAEYSWAEPVEISGSKVWLWNDEPNPGNVRPPESWWLEYRDLDSGELVRLELDDYPIMAGTTQVRGPNEVTFDAVETDTLRLVLEAQPNGSSYYAVAATEWEVWGTQEVAPPEPEDPDMPILYEEVYVRTAVETAPVLPDAMWVLPEYGPLRYEEVAWDAVPADDYAAPGELSVSGAIVALDDPVEATVHVVDVLESELVGVDYAATITTPGAAPVCPSTVVASYADGTRSSTVPVEWAPVDPEEYELDESFFDVTGAVTGTDIAATCTVFVLERVVQDPGPIVSIEWLSAPAGSGWYTELPEFVVHTEAVGAEIASVEYSTDGGETWAEYTGTTTLEREGVVEVLVRATDAEGFVGEVASSVQIDATAPVTSIEWVLSEDGTSAELTLGAEDGVAGSGVVRVLFSGGPDSDPANPDDLNDMWATYEEPFTITLREGVPMYVHIHSQDAAGNQEVTQTVELPPVVTAPEVEFTAEAENRCVIGRAVTAVRVLNEGDSPLDVTISTPYGTRSFDGVAPGGTAFPAFTTRQAQIPAGSATVEVAAVVDGEEVTQALEVPYEAFSCR